MRLAPLAVLSLAVLTQGFARLETSVCGTHRDRWREEIHLHRHVTAKRGKRLTVAASAPAAARNIGDIAILDDSDGVVARRNEFNLDRRTIQFSPIDSGATRYRFLTGDPGYDAAAAASGGSLSPLGDDDSTRVPLPFAFPFFGGSYQQIFVNSDGNLTFGAGDTAISDRSLGRVAAGPPRIAGLFMDLDPTRNPGAVRVLSEPGRFVVSWDGVPQYGASGRAETFQIRLYPTGRIEFAYSGVATDGAVVGISPGGLRGATSIVSFTTTLSGEYSSTIAERFGGTEDIDIVTAAQNFYETHDDAYDYLVFYNNLGVQACPGAVACETTVRNDRSGYGDVPAALGAEFGSASRLQAVLNFGSLDQYPTDPSAIIPARQTIRDTPVTVLAHETGHLFLAYASVRDPNDAARPMLGFQNAHWAFTFNSEASLLEGNRIRDNGEPVSPRFTTTGTVEGYSPLDQYLMGFRAPDEVPPTFLVNGAGRAFSQRIGQTGVSFDGQRRDVSVADIIAAEGRRTPDSTVSQRRFRFAFILIVRQGTTPPQASLDQIDTYRRQFESYYGRATLDRATADTALRMSLRLSTFPAAGVIAGRSITATVSIQKPAAAPLSIALKSQTGGTGMGSSVTIPAGATSASFTLAGVRAGVDEISAQPSDSRYDSAVSRIQVLAGPDDAQLTLVSSDAGKLTLRVSDVNHLPYPGVPVSASTFGATATATSDSDGRVTFDTAGRPTTVQLVGAAASLSVSGSNAGAPFSFSAPVNAASGAPGLSPGEIASIYGTRLTGAEVLLDGSPARVLFASDTRVDFLAPLELSVGSVRVTVAAGSNSADLPAPAPVTLVSPGIFFDPATGYGRILNAGTAITTAEQPAARGDYIEIYATGLGPVDDTALVPEVTIGGAPASVTYSGLVSGYPGLYQVNVQIPPDAPAGEQQLQITIGGVASNAVKIGVR
jgi:uncharacterized protein (TIGR03437 family)